MTQIRQVFTQTFSRHQAALFLLTAGFVVFYFRLFFPTLQLFYTPDIGISDSLHLNYPLKDFLHQSLRQGQLPFWNQDIGTGTPILAESEVGALYLPNLILFSLFSTPLAWNLSYLLSSILCFTGAYLFFLRLKSHPAAAAIAAFSFSFGAFFILHLPHFNMHQAASLFPWLILLTHQLFHQPSKSKIFFFSLILSQQIFAGHLQITFITLVAATAYFLFHTIFAPQSKSAPLQAFVFALISGILLASPQLLPLYQLKQLSGLAQGSSRVFENPFPLKHLLTFITPNIYGSPQNGTYPSPSAEWGIYWENVHYFGLVPLLAIGYFLLKKRTHTPLKPFFPIFLTLLPAFFLALGKYSPLSFIYSLPPFNWFRVPARFFLVFSFFALALASQGLSAFFSALQAKSASTFKLSLLVTVIIPLLDLGFFFGHYHAVSPVSSLLKPPAILQSLPQGSRIATFKPHQNSAWNQIFWHQGWHNLEPYLYLRNGLDANLNLLFGQPSLQSYLGIWPLRQEYFTALLNQSLLNAAAGDYLISPHPFPPSPDLTLTQVVTSPDPQLPHYSLFSNPHSLARFRFAHRYTVKSTQETIDFFRQQNTFDFSDSVILETNPGQDFSPLSQASIEVIKDSHHHLILQTKTDKPAILVVADSFYPDWQARLNHQPANILPANLNQRALIIPSGTNTIEFYYFPKLFILGLGLSALTFALLFFSLTKLKTKLNFKRSRLTSFKLPHLHLFSFKPILSHPITWLITTSIVFFLPLFYPVLQTFFTLDSGRSDLTHYHLPARMLYSQSLKHFSLPFWVPQMGTGFPLFAEGQIGAFFLPNLLLYFLLPFQLAWNLSYPLSFILLSVSTYLLFRHFNLSPLSSFMGSLTFSFNSFLLTHLIHPNAIQTLSLSPIIFLFALKYQAQPTRKNFFLLSFTISQSLLAGYLQYTFITLVGVLFWLFFTSAPKLTLSRFLSLSFIVLATLLAFTFSSIQLLPTLQLLSQTDRSTSLAPSEISKYPFKLTHLITLINPDYFGTPITGSFPLPSPQQGHYWETTLFIGLIPLALSFLGFISSLHPQLKNSSLALGLISLTLALGNNSPLGFLYSLPGFGHFRIPSRFLVLVAFSLAVLSALGLQKLDQILSSRHLSPSVRQKVLLTIILLSVFQLYSFHRRYNPVASFDQLLSSPQLAQQLSSSDRVYTHPSIDMAWRQQFISSGWQDLRPYIDLQNGLAPNQNLLWHLSSIQAYAGLFPARQLAFQTILNQDLINLAAAKYVTSATPLDSPALTLTHTASASSGLNLYLYRNSRAFPRIQLLSNYSTVKTPQEAARDLSNQLVDLSSTAILETTPPLKLEPLSLRQTSLIEDKPLNLIISTHTDKPALLYLADTYYPAWQATIDHTPTSIIPANLNHRALLIPAGKHTIEFSYNLTPFFLGAVISFTSFLLAYLFLWKDSLPPYLKTIRTSRAIPKNTKA